MQCDKCRRQAIIHQRYSGLRLCREHFIADLESKAKKGIRFNGGLSRNDHILLAVHGDYRGCALLHFMAALTGKRRGVRLSAIVIDPSGAGDDDGLGIRNLAASLGIRWAAGPWCGDGEEGALSPKNTDPERIAHEQGATKIVSDADLDDEALFVLAAILKGETERLIGPEQDGRSGMAWIRPFLHIPDREVALYARETLGYTGPFARRVPSDPFLHDAQDLLTAHGASHPSAPHALVNLGERLRRSGIPAPDGDPAGGRRC